MAKSLRCFSYIIFLFVVFPIISCGNDTNTSSPSSPKLPENSKKVTVQQGVWGNVWFWEGNHMPGPPKSESSGGITPVIRDVYIYEETTLDDVEEADQEGGFFLSISTNLVAELKSDNTGFYQQKLPPGKYSIFVKENGLFYADLFSEERIMPVDISENSIVKNQIDITYKAAF